MNLIDKRGHAFKRGAADAIPIAIGYFPIAIAFGVIAVNSGVPFFQTVLMSLIVYAGASQFMAANMVFMHAGLVEIILATFVLNLRHFVMSMSLMNRFSHLPKEWKPLLSFGITDETFAVLSLKEKQDGVEDNQYFVFGVMLTAYSSWVLGTIIGGIFANIIPETIGSAMSIGLYAMFIGLLVPAVRGAWKVGLIAVASMVLSAVFERFLDRGWSIVFATILGSFIGVCLPRKEQQV